MHLDMVQPVRKDKNNPDKDGFRLKSAVGYRVPSLCLSKDFPISAM
jgi:hypothetical protein